MQQKDFGLREPGVSIAGRASILQKASVEDAGRAGALQNRPAVGHHSGRAANIEIGRRRIEGEAGERPASRVRGTRCSTRASRLAQTIVRGGSGASARVMSSASVAAAEVQFGGPELAGPGHLIEHRQERRQTRCRSRQTLCDARCARDDSRRTAPRPRSLRRARPHRRSSEPSPRVRVLISSVSACRRPRRSNSRAIRTARRAA